MPCRPGTTRPTTVGLSGCAQRSPRTSRAPSSASTSSSRPPRPPSRSSSGRGSTIPSRCTSPITARCRCRLPGSPRSLSRPGLPRPLTAGRSFRWAFRSPARRSARTGCSTPHTRSSARSASTRRHRESARDPGAHGRAVQGGGPRGARLPAARAVRAARRGSGDRRGVPPRRPDGHLRPGRRRAADRDLPGRQPEHRRGEAHRAARGRPLLRDGGRPTSGAGLRVSTANDSYEPVIGLEIHVQLSTRTKMFCGCEPSFGDEPNVHTCPVCLGHPGTLPVANEQAIRYALMIAAALECEVAPRSIFHRKNYFYPDLPKGYQISQYDEPLAVNGRLGDVRIQRAHLEEDAAKMIHVGQSGRIHGSGASLVDFNRGGTPLVEIVTEPDLRGAAEAREWAQLLRTTMKQLRVSDVNMEEGSLRCDANVSLRPIGSN